MDTTVRTEPIDFCYDEDTYVAAARRVANQFQVAVTLLNEEGPGGGWPEVSLSGSRDNVLRALREGWGYDGDVTEGGVDYAAESLIVEDGDDMDDGVTWSRPSWSPPDPTRELVEWVERELRPDLTLEETVRALLAHAAMQGLGGYDEGRKSLAAALVEIVDNYREEERS